METALEQLSKPQLIALVKKGEEAVADRDRVIREKEAYEAQLLALIDKFKRMAFAQKRERFEGNKDQLALPFGGDETRRGEQGQVFEQKIEYIRKKKPTSHKGRIPLPDHLPVEEVVIRPEGDLTDMVCIGREVTEELDYVPAKYIVRRYIRLKYAPKAKSSDLGVLIGELPERVIEKWIPGAGLLAGILVDKYMDHLPLYRQLQRFKRENIPIAASTIRVMDGAKKGACHLGYYWVYHNPLEKTVLFDYQPTRGAVGAENLLKGFRGYLQTDGYATYIKLGRQEGVTHLACTGTVCGGKGSQGKGVDCRGKEEAPAG